MFSSVLYFEECNVEGNSNCLVRHNNINILEVVVKLQLVEKLRCHDVIDGNSRTSCSDTLAKTNKGGCSRASSVHVVRAGTCCKIEEEIISDLKVFNQLKTST